MSTTSKQWVVHNKENGFDELSFSEGPVGKVGENEILVKIHGASLNYRDLIIPKVRLPFYLVFYILVVLLLLYESLALNWND